MEDHEVAIDYKKRRKLSAVFKNEAELTKAEQCLRNRRNSADQILKNYSSRYFDNVGAYVGIKPISLYLHNSTADFLMDVVQEYSSFSRYIGAKN